MDAIRGREEDAKRPRVLPSLWSRRWRYECPQRTRIAPARGMPTDEAECPHGRRPARGGRKIARYLRYEELAGFDLGDPHEAGARLGPAVHRLIDPETIRCDLVEGERLIASHW